MVPVRLDMDVWTVPRVWPGERIFLIGGGPSLTHFDFECLRGKKIIVCNSGFRACPWADVLIWMDIQWYSQNRQHLHLHTGEYKVTTCWPEPAPEQPVHFIKRSNRHWSISTNPQRLTGLNTGHLALNLAVLMGAAEVVLLGYDMQVSDKGRQNWHDWYREPVNMMARQPMWLWDFERAERELRGKVQVWQTNPNSQLTCFPIKPLTHLL